MSEQSVATVLDRMLSLTEAAGRVAVERGPEALDTAGRFLQARAAFGIATSLLVALVLVAVCLYLGRHVLPHIYAQAKREGERGIQGADMPGFLVALTVVGIAASGIGALASLPGRDALLSVTGPKAALMVAAVRRLEGGSTP